jgi:hypothetical protein
MWNHSKILLQFSLVLTCTNLAANGAHAPFQIQDPTKRLPFDVTVVETGPAKEMKEIGDKANRFLSAKDYDHLDELANALRASKQSWATGSWKLADVYWGLVPSKTATEAEWQVRLTALRDWVAAKPKSVTARVALAYFLKDYGWHARGSGWADTVTAEGWRLFEQRLTETVQTLKGSEALGLRCPVAWSVLMTSGMGLNLERREFDAIFDKAIHFAPDYKSYYFRRAIYLLPRWNGKPGEWESDLAKSCDRIGGEKGDEVYAQVVWCMHQTTHFTNIFKENNISWERVDKGFAVIEKELPDSLAAKGERAHLAALASDLPKARKYMGETEGKVDLTVWKSKEEYTRFALWAYSK